MTSFADRIKDHPVVVYCTVAVACLGAGWTAREALGGDKIVHAAASRTEVVLTSADWTDGEKPHAYQLVAEVRADNSTNYFALNAMPFEDSWSVVDGREHAKPVLISSQDCTVRLHAWFYRGSVGSLSTTLPARSSETVTLLAGGKVQAIGPLVIGPLKVQLQARSL